MFSVCVCVCVCVRVVYSQAHFRGYPCAVWTLFHVLTVFAHAAHAHGQCMCVHVCVCFFMARGGYEETLALCGNSFMCLQCLRMQCTHMVILVSVCVCMHVRVNLCECAFACVYMCL